PVPPPLVGAISDWPRLMREPPAGSVNWNNNPIEKRAGSFTGMEPLLANEKGLVFAVVVKDWSRIPPQSVGVSPCWIFAGSLHQFMVMTAPTAFSNVPLPDTVVKIE